MWSAEFTKDKYITLDSGENRRLQTVCHATELGDNVSISTSAIGSTQYVRDNPFWELRDDITTLLENAIAVAGGITLAQFNCKWRGNYLVEPGDKIAIVTKDDGIITSYLLDEKYTYNGGFSAESKWEYGKENETESNPNTIGGALKQTFAKVDKANKQIELVASDVQANSEEISGLYITANDITTSVSNTNQKINETDEKVAILTEEVSTKVTAEDVTFSIQTAFDNGVESVTTSTGFTFNEEGLHISKENSEITTSITEDGMTIYRADTPVLVTNHTGVEATNLHATTFLTVGGLNRFEEYIDIDNQVRIGAFWLLG